MRRMVRWSSLAGCALVTLACACQAGAQSPPAARNATADVINRAAVAITDIRLASRVTNGWGGNLLTGEIKPGERRQVTPQRQEGCLYTMRVVYRDNRFEWFGWIDLCNKSGFDLAARVAQQVGNQDGYLSPPSATVTFDNRSGKTVQSLRMAVGGGQIGPDRLGGQPLPPGKTRDIRLDPDKGCLFRIRAIYDDALSEVFQSADLCTFHTVILKRDMPLASHQVPADLRLPVAQNLMLWNQTHMTIDFVYVFQPGAPKGIDRLGRTKYLHPNERWRIEVSDQTVCLVTVQAMYANKQPEQITDFDLCAREEPEVVFRGPNTGWRGPGTRSGRP